MKVSIIGGAGRVGATTAFALQTGGLVRELALVDVAAEAAQGEALDLLHGAAFAAAQRIRAGGYDAVAGSDLVIVSAGLRRRPDESRLELIGRNVAVFRDILGNLRKCRLAEDAIMLVITNPVDVLTWIAAKESGLPPARVIGSGTMLDTVRLRSLLADHFGVDSCQVNALVLGEHGDSQVPVWSTATVNGAPLRSLPGGDQASLDRIFAETRRGGAEVIRLKGGAAFAIALAAREIVHAIALDRKSVLPVSSLQQGAYGISDVCLSLPTVVGRGGVERVIEVDLAGPERQALLESARVLHDTIREIGAAGTGG